MGMFDSVYVECPNCRKLIEFQSKADDNSCRGYLLGEDEVPELIAVDLSGARETCPHCNSVDVTLNKTFKVVLSPSFIETY